MIRSSARLLPWQDRVARATNSLKALGSRRRVAAKQDERKN